MRFPPVGPPQAIHAFNTLQVHDADNNRLDADRGGGPVELAAVVAHAAEAIAPVIERDGHTLTATLPDEPVVLDGDYNRLVQVIGNLLTNSTRHTPPGG